MPEKRVVLEDEAHPRGPTGLSPTGSPIEEDLAPVGVGELQPAMIRSNVVLPDPTVRAAR